MNGNINENVSNEQSLVRLYMDLTGANETEARSVVMYVCAQKEWVYHPLDGSGAASSPNGSLEGDAFEHAVTA